jgi:HK97 family phage portal protein
VGLFSNIFSKSAAEGPSDIKAPVEELNLEALAAWAHLTGGPSWSGMPINDETVLQMTTSWRCIRLISETIGTLPLHLYRPTPSGLEKAKDHKLYRVLHHQPNPSMTSIEWVEAMVVSLCVWGQAYNDVTRLGDRIAGIVPVPKPDVTPEIASGEVVYWHRHNGQRTLKSRDDICPIKGFGGAGKLEGFPPYKMHSQSIGLTLAAEKYGAEFFGRESRPSGVFSGDKWPDPENVKKFEKLFASRGGKPVFVGGNFTYEPVIAPNNESQFNETRETQVRQIANIWGVPADRVLSPGGDTYNNTEQRNLQFLQTTLMPYLIRIEQALWSCLLTRTEQDQGYVIKFNPEGLLRGDTKSRSEHYRNMRGIAGMTVNEVRELENLPRVEGGDDLHMPLNMAPLDQLRTINDSGGNDGNA